MILLAHRGYHSRDQTENSLEAFRLALSHGADGIELDLRLSKDRELIVIHDANLHRVAGDAHKVTELTAAELAAVPLRCGGTVPTFDDVTANIPAPVILDAEVKVRGATGPLIRKLRTSASLRGRVIVSSYVAGILQEVQREAPDVRTMYLSARWPLPLRGKRFWTRLKRLHPWGVAFPLTSLNRRRVSFLRRQGLKIGGWDWHDQAMARDARKAVSLGIDVAILHQVAEARRHLP